MRAIGAPATGASARKTPPDCGAGCRRIGSTKRCVVTAICLRPGPQKHGIVGAPARGMGKRTADVRPGKRLRTPAKTPALQ